MISVLHIGSDFLGGRVERLPVAGVTALHWMLRVACSMCFVGHGAWGFITKADWLPLYGVFGLPESFAWHTMPLVGLLDVTVGIAILFHPCRALLVWMVLWSVFTALLRPLAEMGWWEFVERGGNYGPPIAFLLLARPQQLGWFDRIEPVPVPARVLRQVKWVLQFTIALLFIGHGGLGFFQQQQALRDRWAAVAVPMEGSALSVLGLIEIAAGVGALVVTSRYYLLTLVYWKVATELLHPVAGGIVNIWEWVERGGDYLAPFALLVVLHLLQSSLRAESRAGIVRRSGFADDAPQHR